MQRQARLAAERLFVPIAAPLGSGIPVVTVRRHRMGAVASEQPNPHRSEAQAVDQPQRAKKPRVHLVKALPRSDQASPSVSDADQPAASHPSVGAGPTNHDRSVPCETANALLSDAKLLDQPCYGSSRPPAVQAAACNVPFAVAKSNGGEAAPVRRKPCRAAVCRDEPAGTSFAGYAWPVYPRLVGEIEDLKKQAQDLRALETAEAIRWVRKTVRKLGLSQQDIGFGTSED